MQHYAAGACVLQGLLLLDTSAEDGIVHLLTSAIVLSGCEPLPIAGQLLLESASVPLLLHLLAERLQLPCCLLLPTALLWLRASWISHHAPPAKWKC